MSSPTEEGIENGFPWHLGIFDAHCHPTDTMASIQSIPDMKAKVLTIMATRSQDQDLVAEAADALTLDPSTSVSGQWDKHPRIVPSFGWHPWFSHQMFDDTAYDGSAKLSEEQKIQHYRSVLTPKPDNSQILSELPDLLSLSEFLTETRKLLERYPFALVGEVGLDKSFRIPESSLPEYESVRNDSLTPGGREGRRLSTYRVSMNHQRKILLMQLALAGKLQRAVSVHGVQAHGVLFETLKETWKGHERKIPSKRERKEQNAAVGLKAEPPPTDSDSFSCPYPPRICLHSYSGPAEQAKQYLHPSIPAEIFFSFSTLVNFSASVTSKAEEVIKSLPAHRILVESDLHTAGPQMDHYLEDVVRKVCRIRAWTVEQGVRQLGENWKRFIFGSSIEDVIN